MVAFNIPFLVHVDTERSSGKTLERPSVSALQWLSDNTVEEDLPSDLAAEHDHYLYGAPKKG